MPGLSGGTGCPSAIVEERLRAISSVGWASRAQPPVRPGELPAAGGLDQDVVLDADAAPARQVDTRLDRDHHALFQHGSAARIHAGILVRLQAQAVADAVDEPVAEPAGPDHGPRRLVDLAHRGARL